MRMDDIVSALRGHYSRAFATHGPTARGVDWGTAADVELRYEKMLAVIDPARTPASQPVSLLDAGCGYGGLWQLIQNRALPVAYTGFDVCDNMIDWARAHQTGADFVLGDVMTDGAPGSFDYVVANGILTQKLETTIAAMDIFAQRLVRRMFELCRVGVAFNIMTTKVNFAAPNLYYRNPAEFLAWCQAEITPQAKLDHAYPLYEYTIYLYRA